jgi:hypothetical protein
MQLTEKRPALPGGCGRRWVQVAVAVVVLSCAMVTTLVVVPLISPTIGASVADELQKIMGPGPVAELEAVSFWFEDVINRSRYHLSGGQPQISWAITAQTRPTPTARIVTPMASREHLMPISQPTITPVWLAEVGRAMVITVTATAQPTSTPTPSSTPTASPTATPTSLPGVVDAPPCLGGGWQAFGPLSDHPSMARASVDPDPSRPYAQVALVRFDLSQVRLHLVAGKTEPVPARNVPPFPRPATIPAADQSGGELLAAFNGGFKSRHGAYGMMVDGTTILPPKDNIATLALYQDGSIRLGAWGRGITTTQELIAYRQNCALLVDAGDINSSVADGKRSDWGYTVAGLATTWRSGLGVSRDGRFLIYAVGNSLTVESLALALQEAGSFYAMELDINHAYTTFVTYRASTDAKSPHPAVAEKLLEQMIGSASEYLVPCDRDFFYVTLVSKKQDGT